MRHLLVYAILLTSLPISAPARAAAASPLTPAAAAPAGRPAEDPTPSPTPSPTPTPDPVMDQAQRDSKLAEELKKKAVSDKERAEAEAARLKALVQPFGTPANVNVPTGSVTTDAAGWVESQMLAQEAARQITLRLTKSLCKQPITPGVSPAAKPAAAGAKPAAAPTPQKVRTLVIHSAGDLAGVELYASIMGQLKNLHKELTKKNAEAKALLAATDPAVPPGAAPAGFAPALLPFAAPGIATGVIKSVAELINLFRTDTSFTNQAITLNENTIVSQIVRNFNSGSAAGGNCDGTVRVYHPALYAPRLLESSDTSEIVILLNDVETAKIEAAGNVEKLDARIKELKELGAAFKSRADKSDELADKRTERAAKDQELADCKKGKKPAECRKRVRAEMKALDEEIAQLAKGIAELDKDLKDVKADPKNFKAWVEQLTELRAKTHGMVTATDVISAKLNTPDDTTKLTALAQLIRAEKIHGILKADGSYTLHVEVKANGTTKVKKNLFVDAKVRHSAGADLTYQLIEGGGVIAQGDELKCYIEYQSARNIQDMVSGTGSRRVQCKFPDAPAAEEQEQEQAAGRATRRRKSPRADSGQ